MNVLVDIDPVTVRNNSDDRTIKAVWDLGTITNSSHRPGKELNAAVVLFVSHNKDRKEYTAVAYRVDRTEETAGNHTFDVEMFEVFGGTRVRLSSTKTARYSAQGLLDAYATALAELRMNADTAAVIALADPNSPA